MTSLDDIFKSSSFFAEKVEDDDVQQFGTKRHSGRYPYGSGGDSLHKSENFLDYVEGLKKQGLSDKEIYESLDITSTKFRQAKSIAKNEVKQARISQAQRLRDTGMSTTAIAREMYGDPKKESSVRALLDQSTKDRAAVLDATAQALRDAVAERKYIQVGSGVEHNMGISSTKLKTAVAKLEEEGYTKHYVRQEQQGIPGQFTTLKVLAAPGVAYKEVFANRESILLPTGQYTDDGGRSWFGIKPPLSISSKRVGVKYAEDGGADADGMIFVKRSKKDLSLDGSQYAQVRIAVDGTHYLKGIATPRDDDFFPPGTDIVFNTSKSRANLGSNKLAAMKDLKRVKEGPDAGKVDQDNPFGSMIDRQIGKKGPDGKVQTVTSAMNIVNEQGNWDKWDKNLSSQFLSKQTAPLAKEQLDLTYARRRENLDEIMSLTNPAVKKRLLDAFADDADAAAVHLKAAPLPGQATRVLLPVSTLRPNEVYAPHLKNGTRVALVRFPHGSKAEIPELSVNNRNREARKNIGTDVDVDAIGIHPSVAKRMSGADFDGDTVLVIPNNSGRVQSKSPLRELQNFDPQHDFPKYDGMEVLDEGRKQTLMGDVSNLVTDMTIKGAPDSEIARAIRHSMVIIDAPKHELNWKLSAEVNGISALKKKYQHRIDEDGRRRTGASTIVSQKKSPVNIRERRLARVGEGGAINKETGQLNYVPTGRSYPDPKTGKTIFKEQRVKKLELTDDAHTLSSGTNMERIYADHSNRLKALANEARRVSVNTKNTPYKKDARIAYKADVDTLNAKLRLAQANAPLEKQAQIIAGSRVSAKRAAYPDMSASDLKKVRAQALAEARMRTGAYKHDIKITDSEWNAIQAGAITNNNLVEILKRTDLDRVRKLATPREAYVMTSPKQAQAKALLSRGYTQSEVAEMLGVPVGTLKSSLADE